MKNYTHFIFITSNYKEGKRYGLHFALDEQNRDFVIELSETFSRKDNVAFYTVITDEKTPKSVQDKEPFFKNVELLDGNEEDEIERFKKILNNIITPIDIALLILARIECTYIDLLVYIYHVYCEYFMNYKEMLFDEKLYINNKDYIGYEIKSLSKYFSKITNTNVRTIFDNNNYNETKKTMPILVVTKKDAIYSKFFNCENGIEIMNNLIEIIELLNKRNVLELHSEMIDSKSVIFNSDKNNTFITSKNIRKFYLTHFNKR